MVPAIFLDRDGVIIENRPAYVRSWEDVEIYPFALSALARAAQTPYKFVIVTNQSAVGRGLLSEAGLDRINCDLIDLIEGAGGRIDGIYVCPHAPEANCDCRKPRPGMITRAAAELNLDLSRSLIIGDAVTDLLAGQTAGIPTLALVRTGRGRTQERMARDQAIKDLLVFDNLDIALQRLLGGWEGS